MDNFLIEVFSLDGLFEFYNQIHTFCQFVSGQFVPADNVRYSDVIDFGDRLERFAGHSGVNEMFGWIFCEGSFHKQTALQKSFV